MSYNIIRQLKLKTLFVSLSNKNKTYIDEISDVSTMILGFILAFLVTKTARNIIKKRLKAKEIQTLQSTSQNRYLVSMK